MVLTTDEASYIVVLGIAISILPISSKPVVTQPHIGDNSIEASQSYTDGYSIVQPALQSEPQSCSSDINTKNIDYASCFLQCLCGHVHWTALLNNEMKILHNTVRWLCSEGISIIQQAVNINPGCSIEASAAILWLGMLCVKIWLDFMLDMTTLHTLQDTEWIGRLI
jgi:hypothetical protein